MDLFNPARLPLIPKKTLKEHKVFVPSDTRFRACARLAQALWRQKQGMPIGATSGPRARRFGHLVSDGAAQAGANFLSPEAFRGTSRELAYREPGALIDVQRLYRNLLASMPLAFNLFGHLKADLQLAERFVAVAIPEFAGKISSIQFEHSPGRGDPRFTDDGTAFDVLISLRREDGAKAFIAIEVKYSEGMNDPDPEPRPRYDELSRSSGLFLEPDAPELRKRPVQQLWRQHMLAQAMVQSGLYDTGCVVLVAPLLNEEVKRAGVRYREMLAASDNVVGFRALPLEFAIDAVRAAGAEEHAEALASRYLDFSGVHALI